MNNAATEAAPIGAYLVLVIDKRTNAIANAGIYSEPEPTCATHLRTEVLFEAFASTFNEAREQVRACLREAMQARGNA
jgi:hypothetical protein